MDYSILSKKRKSPAVWAIGMSFIAIAIVLVVVVMTFNVTDSMGLSGAGNTTYQAVKTNLLAAALLFGVVGLALIASLLFQIFR